MVVQGPELICDFGSFDEAVIIKYLKQIMFGVGYLHEHKAIHRDIKGTRVFVHFIPQWQLVDPQ